MSFTADLAHVATVDFRAASNTPLSAGSSVVDSDGLTIASLSLDGLLAYMPARCSVIAFANGTTLNAVRMLYLDGSVYSATDFEQAITARGFRPILVRAVDGGSFTLTHDTPPPIAEWEPTERLATQYGRDVVYANAWAYLQWDAIGGSRRWRTADWGAYLPSTPADWVGAPTVLDTWTAIDRMAAEIVALKGGPIT